MGGIPAAFACGAASSVVRKRHNASADPNSSVVSLSAERAYARGPDFVQLICTT
jgi:hypothetical protein